MTTFKQVTGETNRYNRRSGASKPKIVAGNDETSPIRYRLNVKKIADLIPIERENDKKDTPLKRPSEPLIDCPNVK